MGAGSSSFGDQERIAIAKPVVAITPPRSESERLRQDRLLLARYAQTGDPAVRDVLVERFLPLARQLARRYHRGEEPFDDLFQVASLGLIKAIDRFDASRNIAFSSYAVPTILGEIKRHFRDRTWAMRVPRDLKETALRIDAAVTELVGSTGGQPSISEIAAHLELSEEQVLDGLQAGRAYRATSLQTPRSDEDEETLGDALGQGDSGYDKAEHRATLQALMRSLSQREREVLRLRFQEDLTQAEIGELIGVSQMQVSRIIRQAIAELRAAAAE